MLRPAEASVDLLILGAGWTSTFLIPQLNAQSISYDATTTTGRDGTIQFKFDPESSDLAPYQQLPSARTILITFPLTGKGQSKHMTSLYRQVHGPSNHWIQLGSTGIFNQSPSWNDSSSPYDTTNPRAIAEDELIDCVGGCVLNLSGLWGGSRVPANWLSRVAKTKEDVRAKGCVHFVHGQDVARAIIAVSAKFSPGKRWIVSDLRVYDWWDLILSFCAEGVEMEGSAEEREEKRKYAGWVGELMGEEGVRALPRGEELLGRKLDSRGFWEFVGMWPGHGRLA